MLGLCKPMAEIAKIFRIFIPVAARAYRNISSAWKYVEYIKLPLHIYPYHCPKNIIHVTGCKYKTKF